MMNNIVEILITAINVLLTLYCSWMYRMWMRGIDSNKNYFEAVKERMDYYNLVAMPGLIKYMEVLEKYEDSAKLKKILDETKQRLKL